MAATHWTQATSLRIILILHMATGFLPVTVEPSADHREQAISLLLVERSMLTELIPQPHGPEVGASRTDERLQSSSAALSHDLPTWPVLQPEPSRLLCQRSEVQPPSSDPWPHFAEYRKACFWSSRVIWRRQRDSGHVGKSWLCQFPA